MAIDATLVAQQNGNISFGELRSNLFKISMLQKTSFLNFNWQKGGVDLKELTQIVRVALQREEFEPLSIESFRVDDLNKDGLNEIFMTVNLANGSPYDPLLFVVIFRNKEAVFLQTFSTTQGNIDSFKDVDGDGITEIVIYNIIAQSLGHMGCVFFYHIYQWNGERYVEASSHYSKYYQEFVRQCTSEIKDLSQLDVEKETKRTRQSVGDFRKWQQLKIADLQVAQFAAQHMLGDKTAGFEQAVLWSKSGQVELQVNAVTVFESINDNDSKRHLKELAADPNDLVSDRAKWVLKKPDPQKPNK